VCSSDLSGNLGFSTGFQRAQVGYEHDITPEDRIETQLAFAHDTVSIGRPDNDVLLGPIAVHPAHEGQGIGSHLIRHGLDAAQRAGTGIAVAVGAPGYLGRFGFLPAARHGISLAGLDDAARFLALELEPDALASASGPVECARPGDAR